jgi:hypothetical protein
MLNGQWIEIFRAGEYGQKGRFTEADINRIVANYDPKRREAPAVIGHPDTDAPAYGWVSDLRRQGQVLLARLKQVSPELEEMLKAGAFKKRSAAFYTNPLSLRHIGFLGAAAPHVKGLSDISFCSSQTIEFSEAIYVDVNNLSGVSSPMKRYITFNEDGRNSIDRDSVVLAEKAMERADQHKISYGEALTQVRAERRFV